MKKNISIVLLSLGSAAFAQIGIGVTNPQEILEVKKNTPDTNILKLDDVPRTAGSSVAQLYIDPEGHVYASQGFKTANQQVSTISWFSNGINGIDYGTSGVQRPAKLLSSPTSVYQDFPSVSYKENINGTLQDINIDNVSKIVFTTAIPNKNVPFVYSLSALDIPLGVDPNTNEQERDGRLTASDFVLIRNFQFVTAEVFLDGIATGIVVTDKVFKSLDWQTYLSGAVMVSAPGEHVLTLKYKLMNNAPRDLNTYSYSNFNSGNHSWTPRLMLMSLSGWAKP
ncbi:uncharacterized protein CHSO_1983 [Chryseobacterium sp. StRB126]|uniref:hypothetical protein n=1 Tax=Chryseobacterium sp. StRB126 TaxID=878220 RepID=UPI0004E98C29|nr:hypothetical protein [Chryseobacterium sp. StRB126]BAP31020.1 uncharacterized protein CHSO_1983 [Chryseobacterium sp. StRB126]